MSKSTGYWSRKRLSRRAALRGSALAAAGLAGAVLVGCGGDDTGETAAPTGTSGGTSTSVAAASDGRAPADQVRIPPGRYEQAIPPTAAEMDPAANARRGGTLYTRYLDPPHMDFNRTLSCTINTTLDYTKNKLTRAIFGAAADPKRIVVEPDLAESWESSPDGTQFTFHLRQGVKFHNVEPTNGRELNSEDVKLSFERYKAGGTQKDMFTEVESMDTPDQHTVVVALSQPVVEFPRNVAAWSHIDAREMLADLDFLEAHAVGTGPFIQEEWTQKERSVFVRHPDYFEDGLPYLDKVVATVMDDNAAIRAAFITDNIVDTGARDDTDADDILKSVPDAVMMLYERAQGANSNSFRFQLANPVLQDERVRRAISMSIDRVEYSLAQGYSGGGYPYPAIHWQAIFDERPQLEAMGPWFQPNPEESSSLLQAAGFTAERPLSFEITGWYLSRSYAFPDLVVPMMNAIPELDISYRQVDNPTAVVLLNDRNFEWATGMTYGPPAYSVDQIVYPFFHSQGGLNFGNINDPELDSLIEAQRSEQDEEARQEIWRKIWDRDLDQVYDCYLPYNAESRGLWHNYMLNYRPHGIGGYTCYANGQARAVWLDEGAPNAAVWPIIAGADEL